MDGYRIATRQDVSRICASLNAGEKEEVLVRSLYRSDADAHPFLEGYRGPFESAQEVLNGFTAEGVPCAIRIVDASPRYIELRKEGRDWFPPELGSVVLLVRE